ncbi:MAG TPA: FtsX-like permease family protein [Candidatus Saccharimonadia bacterium]|nr:FtsX-like permease family protein [Candidatus Saccharimonadia bacterium]
MSTVTRGVRNAFRNAVRTSSVVLLLGVASALALALLLANQAVRTKITDLKRSAATTLTVRPAGSFDGEGGGEPLTTADTAKLKALAHVQAVNQTLGLGGGRATFSAGGQVEVPTSNVSLDSSIDPGTLGRRRFGGTDSSNAPAPTFKLPVSLTGIDGNLDRQGQPLKITSGTTTFSAPDATEAIVGQGIATKNNLKVGSTFTAYSTTVKVVGITDAGNQFSNDAVMVPLATAQKLSGQTGEISELYIQADSVENIDAVKTAAGNALGSGRVDITSAAQNTNDAVAALAGIERISLVGSIGAMAAAAVILFLVMVMIVRERRREIGVLKAIGASNVSVVSLFVTEALVLTLCGSLLGLTLAAGTSNQITGALISANQPAATDTNTPGGPRGRGGFVTRIGTTAQSAEQLLTGVKTTLGGTFLLEGLAVTIGIAILGSAVPAWLIAKVRPAEVMRGE